MLEILLFYNYVDSLLKLNVYEFDNDADIECINVGFLPCLVIKYWFAFYYERSVLIFGRR